MAGHTVLRVSFRYRRDLVDDAVDQEAARHFGQWASEWIAHHDHATPGRERAVSGPLDLTLEHGVADPGESRAIGAWARDGSNDMHVGVGLPNRRNQGCPVSTLDGVVDERRWFDVEHWDTRRESRASCQSVCGG